MKKDPDFAILQAASELDQPFSTDEALSRAGLRTHSNNQRRAKTVLQHNGYTQRVVRRPFQRNPIKGWSRPVEREEEQLVQDEAESDDARARRLAGELRDKDIDLGNASETAKLLGDQATRFIERWAGALLAGGFIRAGDVVPLVGREVDLTNLGVNAISRKYEALKPQTGDAVVSRMAQGEVD